MLDSTIAPCRLFWIPLHTLSLWSPSINCSILQIVEQIIFVEFFERKLTLELWPQCQNGQLGVSILPCYSPMIVHEYRSTCPGLCVDNAERLIHCVKAAVGVEVISLCRISAKDSLLLILVSSPTPWLISLSLSFNFWAAISNKCQIPCEM